MCLHDNADMILSDGSDGTAATTDGENSDRDVVTPDEKQNGDAKSINIIATPQPVEEPDTDDCAFIKGSDESESDNTANSL